jgi:hypothetical protein
MREFLSLLDYNYCEKLIHDFEKGRVNRDTVWTANNCVFLCSVIDWMHEEDMAARISQLDLDESTLELICIGIGNLEGRSNICGHLSVCYINMMRGDLASIVIDNFWGDIITADILPCTLKSRRMRKFYRDYPEIRDMVLENP